MQKASCGIPFKVAKERYILDIDDQNFTYEINSILESITPLLKRKKKN